MKEIYISFISDRLSLKDWQVVNCVSLLEEGNTIPFISRYRKERTGGLDDAEVAEIKHWTDAFTEMEKRKETILGVISSQDKLTPELEKRITMTTSTSELEDLYLPFRPKRRTRATVAKEAGLEPLADAMWDFSAYNPEKEAAKYVGEKVATVEDALSGARDILAERLSETASVRETLREIFRTRKLVCKATKAASSSPDAQKYKGYFDFQEPLQRMAPHRLLAVLRAADEGFLTLKIDADPEKCSSKMYYDFCHGRKYPSRALEGQLREAVSDSFSRLLSPSITTEVLKEYKQKADIESINVFGDNLRQLLLSPPVGQKRTLAIDPGFRNGCKTVCLDAQGNLLHHEIIFPHPPQNRKIEAMTRLYDMVEKYSIEAVAIGNGTASRETEQFVQRTGLPENVKVYTVSEDGASIYSASEVAREEFPDEDVTVRGAVSIGRRLMDPLAELVKIDPKNLGIGQYQHDVDQNLLKEKLDNTVESCVNTVGVNLNTASPYLLQYVSGIGPSLAGAIVKFRTENGDFRRREDLMDVPRLGAKAFQQCAGFLRIHGAENPLDNSAVHPESYPVVDRMASDLGVEVGKLVGNSDLCRKIVPSKYVGGEVGLPTVNDIISELMKPGRDPRESAEEFAFSDEIREIGDLVPGMELPGIVTNITAFGAFVDIGIHENGLVHVSKMKRPGQKGMVDPSKVVKLHQKIKVVVLDVDLERNRISLGMA